MSFWNDHKDPYDYEKNTAKKIKGGKKSIASGALFGDMDVNSSYTSIDNKLVTKGHSYRLDYRDFKKVKDQARVDQIPAMLIYFKDYSSGLAVIREEDFIEFVDPLSEDS